MPMPTGFEQASLEIEGGTTIDCWFNPTQYSIAKSNQYSGTPATGASFPKAQFGGGNARQLSVELLFDASPDGNVSAATNQLFEMMEVDPDLGTAGKNDARPPKLKLSWGSFNSFWAVCTSLNVQFTMFKPDGTPIRATAGLTLVQAEEDLRSGRGSVPRPQNPTTRADVQLRAHVIRDGDSLQSIAFEHYGDPTGWRRIAQENGIDDPLRLSRGRSLSIPMEPA
jgi:contractile injection system tube protein/LysM domain-containing protein